MGTYDLACTITGAGGFVGSQLVKALMAQEEYRVRIFAVDVTPGRLVADLEGARLGGLGWTSNGGSMCSFEDYNVHQPLRSDFLAVDAIYHFAGIANPQVYLEDPVKVMDLNLMGLRNILDRIVLWSAHRPRIIYSSTSETYGLNEDVPFVEGESLHVFSDQMRWCYALSKLTGEFYLRAFAREDIRHTIFRFFNFVGPDIDAPGMGRVLTKMVGSALDEGVIHVTEPGEQTRCFTHQDDFVAPLVWALTQKHESPNAWRDDYTINLGTDEEVTMMDLAFKIREILATMSYEPIDVKLEPREEIYGQGYEDCQRRQPDISRARDVFGWEPRRKLDDFLPELVDAIVRRHLRGRGEAQLEPTG